MIREFFYFQKSDRKVILVLLIVIAVAFGIIFFVGGDEASNEVIAADTVQQVGKRDTFRRHADRTKTVYVQTKVVYRDTSFRRAAPKDYSASGDSATRRFPVKIKQGEYVVLNTADTTALTTVPGIGPYFARKIVQYGERLGGYVSVDQLDEIENFPLDAKDYLVINSPQPRKLNLNTLSLYELKKHPYISYFQAKAIIDYRRLHGPLHSLDELSLSRDFTKEAISRLSPYVEFE